MAYKLSIAAPQLSWSSFRTITDSPPADGSFASAAQTDTQWNMGTYVINPEGKPGAIKYRLSANLEIKVWLGKSGSWVKSWALRPGQAKKDLLHHEQGHFDIAALSARDYLADLFLIHKMTFATAEEVQNAMDTARGETVDLIQNLHDAYDACVHPEQEEGETLGAEQLRWDGFFSEARKTARDATTKGPDGQLAKMRLVDVARAAGLSRFID
jgi:hypothetical protein